MDNFFTLTAVGLAYDGIGVAILGFAFFSKSISSMMIETGSYWGGNNALLNSLIQSRTDGVAGTSLLVAGFVLQWLGSNGIACEIVGKSLLIALMAIVLLYVVFLRKRIISLQIAKGEALRKEQLEESRNEP